MKGKKIVKIIIRFVILIIPIFWSGMDTSANSAATDPLIGRWERSSGGNEGMVISIKKDKDSYHAVLLKTPNLNFKVGDLKWKSLKKNLDGSYKAKDLYVYNNKKTPSIYVDINLTLDDKTLIVKSTYPTGVKATSGEKQTWKKLGNTFDVTIDAWPIENTRTSFGYMPVGNYKIDHAQYTKIFGKLDKETLKKIDKRQNKWKGNCFGMAITAMLFHQGKISLPNVEILSKDGYSKMQIAAADWSKKEAMLKKNSELAKIIQRYQIYGDLADYYESYRDYVKVLNEWDNEEPLLVEVLWFDENGHSQGHAMVTDTSKPIEITDDGYERIYLYDPNYPYYVNLKNDKLTDVYKDSTERFIDIHRENRSWRINVQLNGASHAYTVSESSVTIGKKIHNNKTGLILSTLDDLNIPTSFNGTAEIDLSKLNK